MSHSGTGPKQPCGNDVCNCTHSDGCDRGWMDAPPRWQPRADALPASELPLRPSRSAGSWVTATGKPVESARQPVDGWARNDRVRRCPRCAQWDGVTA